MRVSSLKFIVDRPGNYRETLADLPEAKAICRSPLSFLEGGCSLYGLKKSSRGSVYRRLSNPRVPRKTQR